MAADDGGDDDLKPGQSLIPRTGVLTFHDLAPDEAAKANALLPIAQDLIRQAMLKTGEEERLVPLLTNAKVLVDRLERFAAEPSPASALPAPLAENAGMWTRFRRRLHDRADAYRVRKHKKQFTETVAELETEAQNLSRILRTLRPAEDPAFRCNQEFGNCMADTPMAAVGCVLSLFVCTLKQFLKVSVTLEKGGGG